MVDIVLVLYLIVSPVWCAQMRFTGLECRIDDPSFCAIENCIIKPIRRGVKEINGVVRLLQLPIDNITISMQLNRRSYMNTLYRFQIDGCKFWKTKRRNPIANIFYYALKMDKYTNINHSCPYNHDIIINHLILDESWNLPLPIQAGDYVLKFYWLTYNTLRATLILNVQLI